MLRAACLALALLPVAAGAQVLAQPEGEARESAILTIVPDRLLSETKAGNYITDRFEAATRALVAENRSIEAALEAEERDLTSRRAVTEPQEFSRLAAEFDTRVDGIRKRQDEKSRELARARDADHQAFLQAAIPLLAEMMQDAGAVAILDRSSVFLSFDLIDVTDAAIERIDEELGEGAEIFAPRP